MYPSKKFGRNIFRANIMSHEDIIGKPYNSADARPRHADFPNLGEVVPYIMVVYIGGVRQGVSELLQAVWGD